MYRFTKTIKTDVVIDKTISDEEVVERVNELVSSDYHPVHEGSDIVVYNAYDVGTDTKFVLRFIKI